MSRSEASAVEPLDRAGGRLRTLAQCAVALTLGLAGIELSAALLLRVTEGRWVGYGVLREARLQATSRERREAGPPPEVAARNERRGGRRYQRQVLHPYVGYVFDPTIARARGGRFDASVEGAHEYGFNLGDDLYHEPEPGTGTVVVAITGGSVAHGFASRHADRLWDELAQVRPDLADIVVLNLAVPGYKQPQQLMAAAWTLSLGARFDALVNIDGFNEVVLGAQNAERGVFPLYPRSWDVRVRAADPGVRGIASEIRVLRRMRADTARWFSSAPWDVSLAAGLVWCRVDRVFAARTARLEQRLFEAHRALEHDYQSAGPRREYEDEHAMYADLAAAWQRASLLLADLVRAGGGAYLHFLQPNQYVPGSKPMGAEEAAIALKRRRSFGETVRIAYPLLSRAGAELRDEGVAFHDLTSLFVDETEPIYRDGCCHFGQRGHALLARAIARALAEELPLAPNDGEPSYDTTGTGS